MSVAERKEREKEQRRSDIIDAAEKLFFSNKFDDVSMDDIAKAAELSRATLYLYFADKESLFFAVILRGVRIMSETFKENVDRESTGLGIISAVGNAFIKFNNEHSDYYRLLQYASSRRFEECDCEYLKKRAQLIWDLSGPCAKALKRVSKTGRSEKTSTRWKPRSSS